jgi:hypothetical protein
MEPARRAFDAGESYGLDDISLEAARTTASAGLRDVVEASTSAMSSSGQGDG